MSPRPAASDAPAAAGPSWRVRVETPAPSAAARFWSRMMGWRVEASDETAARLSTTGPEVVFTLDTSTRVARRPTFEVEVRDVAAATDVALRWGAWESGTALRDPGGTPFRFVASATGADLIAPPPPNVQRYVAIGDSTTEGLVDGSADAGWIGWADRFAARLAAASDHPVEYANLAISGYRLHEIHEQLEPALAMRPDLMSIVGGVNDILGLRPSYAQMERHLDDMFAAATAAGVRVLTFTMPDISRANPVATVIRDRLSALNEIIRRCALRHDVAFIDFERIPVAAEPALWGEDRLHINSLGHLRVAAALAWLVSLPGADRSWADPLHSQPGEPAGGVQDNPAGGIGSNLHWARRHFGPWVVKGIRGAEYRQGAEAKRPTPMVVHLADVAGAGGYL